MKLADAFALAASDTAIVDASTDDLHAVILTITNELDVVADGPMPLTERYRENERDYSVMMTTMIRAILMELERRIRVNSNYG